MAGSELQIITIKPKHRPRYNSIDPLNISLRFVLKSYLYSHIFYIYITFMYYMNLLHFRDMFVNTPLCYHLSQNEWRCYDIRIFHPERGTISAFDIDFGKWNLLELIIICLLLYWSYYTLIIAVILDNCWLSLWWRQYSDMTKEMAHRFAKKRNWVGNFTQM